MMIPSKKIIAIIPARMGASRFPGKPLARILDLPMIEHVRRRVGLCELLSDVYVATCDQEIMDVVINHGGKAIMTANTHERCTDRVEEAVQGIEADIIVIVQGDEPLFIPNTINALVEPMLMIQEIRCTNLLSRLYEEEDLDDKDIVKAVLDNDCHVMYYSRAPIPYSRVNNNCPLYRQTGLAAFTKSFLHEFSNLPPTIMEIAESIDFLRILEHRFSILGVIYEQRIVGVDQPEHIKEMEAVLQNDEEQNQLYQRILNQCAKNSL